MCARVLGQQEFAVPAILRNEIRFGRFFEGNYYEKGNIYINI